jgi:S1-C subfamily serine protease
MNPNDISTQLLYTTLPIWIEHESGGRGLGTGFILMVQVEDDPRKSIPLLVTNFHVIANAKRGLIEFVEQRGDEPAPGARIRVEIDKAFLEKFLHAEQSNDLAAIPIAPILNQLASSGKGAFFRSITPDLIPSSDVIGKLAAIEEITFIGYPSGLYDQHNVTPLVRRGITATPIWNDFQGEPSFLIDAGVFPGSSGSPVFLIDQGGYQSGGNFIVGSRLFFLGILSESFIRKEKISQSVFLGLGKVIKSQTVWRFAQGVVQHLLG